MAIPEITKETLEYLAGLARIELDPEQEEKLLQDMQNIVGHVSELQELDTSNVQKMNGGTLLTNTFREDDGAVSTHQGAGTDQFSDSKDGFLKIPPVFGGNEANKKNI